MTRTARSLLFDGFSFNEGFGFILGFRVEGLGFRAQGLYGVPLEGIYKGSSTGVFFQGIYKSRVLGFRGFRFLGSRVSVIGFGVGM